MDLNLNTFRVAANERNNAGGVTGWGVTAWWPGLLGTDNLLGLNLYIDSSKAQLTCQDQYNSISRKLSSDKKLGIKVLALISQYATSSRNSKECPPGDTVIRFYIQCEVYSFFSTKPWKPRLVQYKKNINVQSGSAFYHDFTKSQDDWLKGL